MHRNKLRELVEAQQAAGMPRPESDGQSEQKKKDPEL
jgi:hypothetical protein